MKIFLLDALIHASSFSSDPWGTVCYYWNWTFWIGFIVGVIGAGVFFFMKSPEDK